MADEGIAALTIDEQHTHEGCELGEDEDGQLVALDAVTSLPLEQGRVIRLRIRGVLYCYDVVTLKRIIHDAERQHRVPEEPMARTPLTASQIARIKQHPVQMNANVLANEARGEAQRAEWEMAELRQMEVALHEADAVAARPHRWLVGAVEPEDAPAAVVPIDPIKKRAVETYIDYLAYFSPVYAQRWDTMEETRSPIFIIKAWDLFSIAFSEFVNHPHFRVSMQLPQSIDDAEAEFFAILLSWRPRIVEQLVTELIDFYDRDNWQRNEYGSNVGLKKLMSLLRNDAQTTDFVRFAKKVRQHWLKLNPSDSFERALRVCNSMKAMKVAVETLINVDIPFAAYDISIITQRLLVVLVYPYNDPHAGMIIPTEDNKSGVPATAFQDVFADNITAFYQTISLVTENHLGQTMAEKFLRMFAHWTPENGTMVTQLLTAFCQPMTEEWFTIIEKFVKHPTDAEISLWRWEESHEVEFSSRSILIKIRKHLERIHMLQQQIVINDNDDDNNDNVVDAPDFVSVPLGDLTNDDVLLAWCRQALRNKSGNQLKTLKKKASLELLGHVIGKVAVRKHRKRALVLLRTAAEEDLVEAGWEEKEQEQKEEEQEEEEQEEQEEQDLHSGAAAAAATDPHPPSSKKRRRPKKLNMPSRKKKQPKKERRDNVTR